MLNRRDFLKTGSAIGALSLLAPLSTAAPQQDGRRLSKTKHQSLLHHRFRCLSDEGEAKQLELVAVTDGPQQPGLEQYALAFRQCDAAQNNRLSEGLHRLYHRELGFTLLHLTPSDSKPGHYITYLGMFA